MVESRRTSIRQEFQSRVRVAVAGVNEIAERYAANLSDGGMFVRDDAPPPIGSKVLVEFVLPDGSCLSRVAGEVVHARPATVPDEKHAGMGIKFHELDAVAKELVAKLDAKGPATAEAPRKQGPWVDTLAPPERAPLFNLDGPVIGIDLGTVNSCVAYVKDDRPYVLTSKQGYQIIPSVVFVAQDGPILVGHRAVEKMILAPSRAIHGSKRFLGRPFASKEVRTLGHFLSYELVAGPTGRVAAKIGYAVIPLEQVAGLILGALKEVAQEQLGRPVRRAVISVPAYFGETQRQAVRDAGRHAGLHVERILNEPTAAAVAYGVGRDFLGTILVYDLGGGTFDVSLLRVDGQKVEVLETDGDPFLGGADFDDRLTEYVLMQFERTHGVNLRTDAVAVQRIRFAAELAKRQLSEATQAEIFLPYIARSAKGNVDLKMRIDREMLEGLTNDLVDRTFSLVQSVLDRAKVDSAQLDDVLLVGGQTRMPLVRRRLHERFGKKPSSGIHPDEAVAQGAAVIALAIEKKRSVDLIDILPVAIRAGAPDGGTTIVFPRRARLPAKAELDVPCDAQTTEFKLALYRGEAERAADNAVVGVVRLLGSSALSLAGAKAHVTVDVSSEGILSASMRHPTTGQVQQLEASLLSASIA